jgi:hypothetical protein
MRGEKWRGASREQGRGTAGPAKMSWLAQAETFLHFAFYGGAAHCAVGGYPTGQMGKTDLPFASLSTSARPK